MLCCLPDGVCHGQHCLRRHPGNIKLAAEAELLMFQHYEKEEEETLLLLLLLLLLRDTHTEYSDNDDDRKDQVKNKWI